MPARKAATPKSCRQRTLALMRRPPPAILSGALLVSCNCPCKHWVDERTFYRKRNRWNPAGNICFLCKGRRTPV